MSLEWNSYTIGESCELITGFPFKSKYYLDEGLFKVVRGDNVKEGFIKWDDKKRCWNELNDKLKKVILKEEDIVIGMDGSKLGKNRATISKKDLPALLAQRVACVRAKEGFDQNYIKYVILSNYFKSYVDKVKTGTSIPHISLGQISEFTFEAPDYKKQKTISSILSTIDKKITVNQEINKNLEQLMKCIFEDWFVNFNYSEDISFKSSELGEIPSNWNVKKLSDVLITLESGKRPKGGISDIEDGIPSIGAENILGLGKFNYSKNKLISHEFFSTLKKGVIQDKDVLLYKDGAQLGRKSLFMKGFPFDICCINEHVFRLQTNDEINQFYLYLWLDQEVMTNEIINLNSNSAQPGINQNDVKSLPILVPELKIIGKFNKIISPMMNQIFDNALEINKLTKLRDTLLPKLMSGELMSLR